MPNQTVDDFFNDLYQKYHRKVLEYIIVKCGDTEDIEDIFQETFLEMAEIIRKKGTAYVKQPEAVLMTVARQKISRHFTLMQRISALKEKIGQWKYVEEKSLDYSGFTLDNIIVREETLEEINEILGKQDTLTRRIFYLHYYQELMISEIAGLLEISGSSVKNRLYRTLRKIKLGFEERGEDYE